MGRRQAWGSCTGCTATCRQSCGCCKTDWDKTNRPAERWPPAAEAAAPCRGGGPWPAQCAWHASSASPAFGSSAARAPGGALHWVASSAWNARSRARPWASPASSHALACLDASYRGRRTAGPPRPWACGIGCTAACSQSSSSGSPRTPSRLGACPFLPGAYVTRVGVLAPSGVF